MSEFVAELIGTMILIIFGGGVVGGVVLKKSKAEKIVYVSCDPVTLARDLNELKSIYKIEEIIPVDMFPYTHHVESIVQLEKI